MATSIIRPIARRVGHAVLAGATAVSAIRRLHASSKPTVKPSTAKTKARKKESSILKRRASKTVKIRPQAAPHTKPAAKKKAKPRIIPGTPRQTKAQRSAPTVWGKDKSTQRLGRGNTVLAKAVDKIKSMRAPKRYTNSGKVIR